MASKAADFAETVMPGVSPRARKITLALLTITYFFSYMDRQILSILIEDIKADLVLTDTQIGIVAGLAFAVFYATLGIPVAWLADRKNRRNIISVALALWSGATALCGFANNFVHLLLARIGVGIGEAGSSPPSHSMIADLYGPKKRAGALAIYSLGVTLGAAMGTILGGTIAHFYGWRMAFFVIGLPGILLAIAVRLFAVEPPRGMSDAAQTVADDSSPSLWDGFRALWQNRAARHLVAGVTITSMIGYALTSWGPAYYIRSFGFDKLEIALYIAPILAVAGVAGTVGGGKLADRLAERHGLHSQSMMIAVGKTAALPFLFALYLLQDAWWAMASYFIALLFQSCYLGPTFALIQGLAPLKMRAVWAAITLLVINLIGLGAGPTAIGILSDVYRGAFGEESLRYALLTGAAFTPWAVWHYWRAGKALKEMERAAA
ncbi:spinster family MFS transporter [Novosphingopyxis iocasae]|uniref:spinster family MFS transporter n=1 Tax=Novosphingopyxis iocasae TaxID=2762729 RepID=UPI001651499C|nr:MFS transporter [Novosphingopyxis iocasae]